MVHAVNHLEPEGRIGPGLPAFWVQRQRKTNNPVHADGIVRPYGGTFGGLAIRADRQPQAIGALIETPNFYPYLSLEQNLKNSLPIKGVDKRTFSGWELSACTNAGSRNPDFIGLG